MPLNFEKLLLWTVCFPLFVPLAFRVRLTLRVPLALREPFNLFPKHS